MASNVKSAPIGGRINVIPPNNDEYTIHPVSQTDQVLLSDVDKENPNIVSGSENVSDVISLLGKLAFKDEVNLDSVEFNTATQTEDGLMSKEDKTKLDNIPSTGFFVDSELSEESENPVQNKVITNALKNVTVEVDDALSLDSDRPVQNKVITESLNQKLNYVVGTEKPTTPNTFWIELK